MRRLSYLANAKALIFARLSFAALSNSAQTRFSLTWFSAEVLLDRVPARTQSINLGLSVNDSPGVWLLDKRVEKIIAMMREDVRGELSLGEFAQSVNLSVWRLCHIFKSDVGMPPIRYLRLLRMERAKDLLESSFLSVKEIAYQVGLNDESHFVRDFKSTYGFSPALYRTHFKNNNSEEPHNGNNVSNGNNGTTAKPSKLQQELIRVAKNSVLPSIHLVVCMVSYLT